ELTYFSPVFWEDGRKDVIKWRMMLRHDRVGDHAVGTILIEIRSNVPYPQLILAATLPDGDKLTIDRATSASESCPKSERCEIFQKVFLEITGEQVLATNGKALKV